MKVKECLEKFGSGSWKAFSQDTVLLNKYIDWEVSYYKKNSFGCVFILKGAVGWFAFEVDYLDNHYNYTPWGDTKTIRRVFAKRLELKEALVILSDNEQETSSSDGEFNLDTIKSLVALGELKK